MWVLSVHESRYVKGSCVCVLLGMFTCFFDILKNLFVLELTLNLC